MELEEQNGRIKVGKNRHKKRPPSKILLSKTFPLIPHEKISSQNTLRKCEQHCKVKTCMSLLLLMTLFRSIIVLCSWQSLNIIKQGVQFHLKVFSTKYFRLQLVGPRSEVYFLRKKSIHDTVNSSRELKTIYDLQNESKVTENYCFLIFSIQFVADLLKIRPPLMIDDMLEKSKVKWLST